MCANSLQEHLRALICWYPPMPGILEVCNCFLHANLQLTFARRTESIRTTNKKFLSTELDVLNTLDFDIVCEDQLGFLPDISQGVTLSDVVADLLAVLEANLRFSFVHHIPRPLLTSAEACHKKLR